MTLRKPAFLAPFQFPASPAAIRLVVGASNVTLNRVVDPYQTFWIGGDGQSGSNRSDLLSFVSGAINQNVYGLTASVSLDPDTQRVVMSGNIAFAIHWNHAAMNAGLHEVLGFPYSQYPSTITTQFEAPSQSGHSWLPDYPVSFDTYEEPIIVGHKVFSLDMTHSGYDFSPSAKERQLQFEYLPSGSVLSEMRPGLSASSLETFFDLTKVKEFRLYDDRSNRGEYGVYVYQDMAKPWFRNQGTRQIRYDSDFRLYGLRRETGDFVSVDLEPIVLTYDIDGGSSAVINVTSSGNLTWTTQYATSVDIGGVGTGLAANGGTTVTASVAGTIYYPLTASGPGGTDTALVSVEWVSGATPSDIFSPYTWDLVYLPKDINESGWTWEPSVFPGVDISAYRLEHKGTVSNRPITSQSSAPLSSAGLGPDVTNLGVRMNTVTGTLTTTGFASPSASQWSFSNPNDVMHYRHLIYQHETINGRRLWNWQETTTKYFRITENTVNRWSVNARNDPSGTLFSRTTTSDAITGGAHYLVDLIHRPQGITLFVNGNILEDYTHTEVLPLSPDLVLFGLGGAHNGAVAAETTHYWFGARRLGVSGAFSQAQHLDDVTGAFGL